MTPRISSSIVRIRPSADTGLIPIVNSRCSRPRHLHDHSLPHNSIMDAFFSCLCPFALNSSNLSIGSCKESWMIVIGQLIHGHIERIILKAWHMMTHSTFKCLRIAQQIISSLITVFFYTGQEPCDRLHKCLIVHHGIPFIPFKPWSRICIIFSQNQGIRICFFDCFSETFPE